MDLGFLAAISAGNADFGLFYSFLSKIGTIFLESRALHAYHTRNSRKLNHVLTIQENTNEERNP